MFMCIVSEEGLKVMVFAVVATDSAGIFIHSCCKCERNNVSNPFSVFCAGGDFCWFGV